MLNNLIYKNKICRKNMSIGHPQDYREAPGLVAYEHAHGKKVVIARETFDVGVNLGHRDFLKRAKELGDVLIVNVNNDIWVRDHKKEKYSIEVPVVPERERAMLVADQEMVDYVFVHPAHADIHPSIVLAIECSPNVPDVLAREDKDPQIIEIEKKQLFRSLGYIPDMRALTRSSYNISTSSIINAIAGRVQTKSVEEILNELGIIYDKNQLSKLLKNKD